jgi:hypothetical protein
VFSAIIAPAFSTIIAPPFSAGKRRRSDIVQQSSKAQLLTVALFFSRMSLRLGGDPVTLKPVDLVVDVTDLFSVIDGFGLGIRDLVGDLLYPLDEILKSSRRKLHGLDPVP